MATFNALRINKNDQKKRRTLLSFVIPAGTTVAQLQAGLLLGYTQEKCVLRTIDVYNTSTGANTSGVVTTGSTSADIKVGNATATANKFYDAVQPIVFRAAGATAAVTVDMVIVMDVLEVYNTDGYLVGPNTANLRAPLDDQGNPCVEFPDIAPNTRAF